MSTFFLRANRALLMGGLFCACLPAQIQLAVTLSPPSLQVNESGRLLISLTNANAGADTPVRSGDVLRLYLALGDATIRSVDLTLGGRTFRDGDWVVDNSAGTNPVTLV